MADILSEKQMVELIEAFHAIDEDNDGVILSSKLGAVLRVMGQNPTVADLQVYGIKWRTFNSTGIQVV